MMRIGFDAKRAFHTARGLGSYARTTVRYLSQSSPNDQFVLFTPPLKKNKLDQWHLDLPNVEVVTPTQWWAKLFPSLWRSFYLASEVKKQRIDLYHGLSHELPYRIERLGIKSVVTIHDLIYVKFPHFFNFVDRYIFEKKFSSSVRRADTVITICHQTKEDVIEHFHCPEQKIEVLYQSCHPRFFASIDDSSFEHLAQGVQLPERYFFYLGAIVPNKNLELVMRALARFNPSDRPHFVIAGAPSSHSPKLQELQQQLGLQQHITWFFSPRDELLPFLYRRAQFFCFPSFYEGFGIPVIESLCCGTPVITSKQGALREAAGEGGIFIDPTSVDECYQAIDLLWKDQSLRADLANKGLQHVKKFSPDAVTQELLAIYRKTFEATAQ